MKKQSAVRTFLILGVLVLAWCGLAAAVTSLEGYTEAFAQLNGDSRVWRLDNPQFLGELRIKSSPWQNTEGFLKFQGLSNKWDNERWENFFFLKEGHLKFRGNRVEAYLFTGQDRFWLNEPLLNLVSQDVIKDDDYGPKAQGVRLDVWDIWGFTFTAFYSDKSTPYPGIILPDVPSGNTSYLADIVSTDDYRASRLRRPLLRDRLVVGATYARKDYGRGKREYDEIAGGDFEVALGDLARPISRFGRVTLFGEAGRNLSGWLAEEHPKGWKLEMRDFGYGPLTMIGSLYDYDDNFYTQGLARGDIWDDNDYHGHYVQLDCRLPRKAINLKGWRFRNKPHTFTSARKPFEETGGEVYVEFVRGFKGRVEYKRHINKDGTWPNLLFEVSGENRLVRIRTQFRMKDMGTDYRVRVYGFEANANLTDTWKLYTRLLTVDEKTEARETVFAQLQYKGWNSAEFFVEFGDGGQSNDLANTEGFISHDSSDITRRVFKAFLRLNY
ncbi:MAG: hypothetical protein V1694_02450 [Candidatus Eisenbacteria bacterium]